eukprot:1592525-Pleurochrysis_carterae.AAC.1
MSARSARSLQFRLGNASLHYGQGLHTRTCCYFMEVLQETGERRFVLLRSRNRGCIRSSERSSLPAGAFRRARISANNAYPVINGQ